MKSPDVKSPDVKSPDVKSPDVKSPDVKSHQPRESMQAPARTPSGPDSALPGLCPNAPARVRRPDQKNWDHHPGVVRSLSFPEEAAAVSEDGPKPDAKPH